MYQGILILHVQFDSLITSVMFWVSHSCSVKVKTSQVTVFTVGRTELIQGLEINPGTRGGIGAAAETMLTADCTFLLKKDFT